MTVQRIGSPARACGEPPLWRCAAGVRIAAGRAFGVPGADPVVAGAAIAAIFMIGAVAGVAGIAIERIAMLLLIAPLLEEAAFRAGLQEALLRLRIGALPANLATASMFAISHAALRGSAASLMVFVPACAMGFAYQRRRRVRDCALLHATLNALWFAWTIANATTA